MINNEQLVIDIAITSSAKKRPGRAPGLYTYTIVECDEKEYAIVTVKHKTNDVKFVIDHCNLAEVLTKSWHLSSGKYIATHSMLPNGKSKEIYLHNFIKENCINEDPDKIVVHINNNMLDNRVENLRIVDESTYVPLRNRKRRITLPANCGFVVDDIPKYLTFTKATGEHGDRFVIEIPQINMSIKLQSSKKISLKRKLNDAIEKLNEIYKTHPSINPLADEALKHELNTSLRYILEYHNDLSMPLLNTIIHPDAIPSHSSNM